MNGKRRIVNWLTLAEGSPHNQQLRYFDGMKWNQMEQRQRIQQFTSSFPKKNNLIFFFILFVNGMSFISWNKWIKKYYNSISRQSGIVHKDKSDLLGGFVFLFNSIGGCPRSFISFISFHSSSSEWAGWRNKEKWRAGGPFSYWEWIKFEEFNEWTMKKREERAQIKSTLLICGAANNTTHSTINTNHNQTINSIKDIWLIEFDLWIGLLIELIGLLLPAHTSIQR